MKVMKLNEKRVISGIELQIRTEYEESKNGKTAIVRLFISTPNDWYRYMLSYKHKKKKKNSIVRTVLGVVEVDEDYVSTVYKYNPFEIFEFLKLSLSDESCNFLKFVYQFGIFSEFFEYEEQNPSNDFQIALVLSKGLNGTVKDDIVLQNLPKLNNLYEELPDEIIFEISLYFPFNEVINVMSLVNKRFYTLLSGKIYFQSLIKLKCKEFLIKPPDFRKERTRNDRKEKFWKDYYSNRKNFGNLRREKFVESVYVSRSAYSRNAVWYKYPGEKNDWVKIEKNNILITKDVPNQKIDWKKVRFAYFQENEKIIVDSVIHVHLKLHKEDNAFIEIHKNSYLFVSDVYKCGTVKNGFVEYFFGLKYERYSTIIRCSVCQVFDKNGKTIESFKNHYSSENTFVLFMSLELKKGNSIKIKYIK